MPKPRLPDLADSPPPPASPSATAPAAAAAQFETWRCDPALADWVRGWLDELAQKHGSALPELLLKGLGGRWNTPAWMRRDSPKPCWLCRFLRQGMTTLDWFERGFLRDDPSWLEDLVQKESAQVSRSFLLSGNITDYAFDPVHAYRPTINLLLDRLARMKDCVLHFRLSHGLRLHRPVGDDTKIRDKLPQNIRSLLETPFPRPDSSLDADIRTLINTLHRWLAGRSEGGQEGAGVEEFSKGVAIVFENVNLVVPPHGDSLERSFMVDTLLHWSISPEMFRKKHCLILMAEAIAGASGISMAKLGNIRGMYVGQSERNLSRVFSLIEALYPVIVFVDELDQAIGQRGGPSGDSGVDSRLFGRFLEFMSNKEHRGRILWIGASNLPDKIDSALKRPGRFDLVSKTKTSLRILAVFALCSAQLLSSQAAQPAVQELVTAFGVADIALAGQPNGWVLEAGCKSDSAPLDSPVEVGLVLSQGSAIQIASVTGSVDVRRSVKTGPDGNPADMVASAETVGLSGVLAPAGALVGVFLGRNPPTNSLKPPNLNFTGAARDLPVRSPLLQQPFYIGGGRTSTGLIKSLLVPQDATRLLLGVLDTYGCNADNNGSYKVTVIFSRALTSWAAGDSKARRSLALPWQRAGAWKGGS